jgi:serine/threonine protein kinase
MVLEYADMGDLENYINEAYFVRGIRLPERRIWRFFNQIASAIAYMHTNRVLHRGNFTFFLH